MKQTPISGTTPAPAPTPPTHLTHVRVTVAGLGQTVMTNGSGSVADQALSCIGTLAIDQGFEVNGVYDVYSGQKMTYTNVAFTGGSGVKTDPWTFNVGTQSDA